MRIYVPTTLDALTHPWTVPAGDAFAVTASLRRALPGEDEEGLEFAAFHCAAEEALWCHLDRPGAPALRAVVTVELPDVVVVDGETTESDTEPFPGRVTVTAPQAATSLLAIHVDEPAAAADVAAALKIARDLPLGDSDMVPAQFEEACERVFDRDLLWYDPSELGAIPRP